MRARIRAIGVLLTIGTATFAEPPKSGLVRPTRPAQTAQRPVQIVLASAESVPERAAVPPQPGGPAAKRKVAPRITTCRCGDPQVDPETQDQ